MPRSRARRRRGLRFAAAAAGLLLAACDSQDTGYVQVILPRTGAGAGIALYLDRARLDFSRGTTVVMQSRVGRVSLKSVDSAWGPAICRVVVRKNRIAVLTVVPTENPPRCICQVRAPESTPAEPVCM